MKYILSVCVLALLPLCAQPIKFPASLDRLAKVASETVDINLDANMLQLASKTFSDKKTDESKQAKINKLASRLKGIHIKSFEFDKAGMYEQADVDAIRALFQLPAWSRMFGVNSKRDGENVDIYARMENNQMMGLAIVSAEPKELTIVHIDGPVSLEDLADLGGQFGIPNVKVKPKVAGEAKPKK